MRRLAVGFFVIGMILAMMIAACTTQDAGDSSAAQQPAESGGVTDEGLIVQTPDEVVVQQPEPAQQTAQGSGDDYAVACNTDADCGEPVYGEKYCFQNGVVTPVTKPVCTNPGSVKSYCRNTDDDEVKVCDTSREICRNAKCLVLAEQPCTDSDGGKDYFEAGEVYDAKLLKYNDYCIDKDTVMEYYCEGGDKGIAKEIEHSCMGGQCINGGCTED